MDEIVFILMLLFILIWAIKELQVKLYKFQKINSSLDKALQHLNAVS